MSLDATVEFLQDHFKQNARAYNNEARREWSTSNLSTLDELFTSILNRDEENARWGKEWAGEKRKNVLSALQSSVGWMSGLHRDCRVLFASWDSNKQRKQQDWDRYAYNRNAWIAVRKLAELSDILKTREKP